MLHNENLPPTQSGIERILSWETPNSLGVSVLFEIAIKWSFITFSLALSINQALTLFAFSSVSMVVKVFETIIKSVVSGFRSFRSFDVKSESIFEYGELASDVLYWDESGKSLK